jgi:leucyl-tRNA synthetase
LAFESWPQADPRYLVDELVTVVVQVNGKLRDRLEVPADAGEDTVKELILSSDKIAKWLEGKQIVKTVYVPGKLVNLVVK